MLERDPYTCDVPELRWEGELAKLANGATIVSVSFTATALPGSYRCEIGVRAASGAMTVHGFAWTAA